MRDTVDKYKFLVRKIIREKTGVANPDLEQEVFIRVWQKQHLYTEQGREKSWICVIANNICTDYFRSRQFAQAQAQLEMPKNLADPAPTPDAQYSSRQRQKIILGAVGTLPHRMRRVVELHEFEDWTIEQIADHMNIPAGTVKSRLHTAKKILAEKLAHLCPNEPNHKKIR